MDQKVLWISGHKKKLLFLTKGTRGVYKLESNNSTVRTFRYLRTQVEDSGSHPNKRGVEKNSYNQHQSNISYLKTKKRAQ